MAYTFTRKTDNVDDVMAADINELQAAIENPKYIQESGGPTTLEVGAVADGEFLKRSGTNVVGGSAISGTQSKSVSIFFLVPVVGDGAYYFDIPAEMNGWELTDVHAHAITAPTGGLVTIQIRNVTDAVDALSTPLTIDAGENDSNTAATPFVINTATDDVATDDIWAIDFDAVNGAEKVIVRLTFSGELS